MNRNALVWSDTPLSVSSELYCAFSIEPTRVLNHQQCRDIYVQPLHHTRLYAWLISVSSKTFIQRRLESHISCGAYNCLRDTPRYISAPAFFNTKGVASRITNIIVVLVVVVEVTLGTWALNVLESNGDCLLCNREPRMSNDNSFDVHDGHAGFVEALLGLEWVLRRTAALILQLQTMSRDKMGIVGSRSQSWKPKRVMAKRTQMH